MKIMQYFDDISIPARTVWAKSAEPKGYSLLCHLLDVAAVSELLLEREPQKTISWAAQGLGLKVEDAIRWIAALAGLHDFGKAIPGFQNKWREGKEADEKAGLTFNPNCLKVKNHDNAVGVLKHFLSEKLASKQQTATIIGILGAHHGSFSHECKLPKFEGEIWQKTRKEIFECYWNTLDPKNSPLDVTISLPVIEWLAGLVSVSDWIASTRKWFPPEEGERSKSLSGHFQKSKKLAEKALSEINWPRWHILQQEELPLDIQLGLVLGNKNKFIPRPLQSAGIDLLKNAHGPSLLLIEAPMGEGKTELAYLAYLHLQALNHHRGLYVALPTQATSNAIFDRMITFLRSFTKENSLDIQLVHAGTLLNEKVQALREGDFDATINSSVWFSQRKKGLLSPYGVGTIDQVLLSILHTKHHFVRLWGLTNRVIVLDEVHAYDTYTSGLITALISWLQEMHCSVILMSATLPDQKRQEFINAWGNDKETTSLENYPRLTLVTESTVLSRSVSCRSMSPIQICGIDEDIQSILNVVVEKLRFGGCGAVILNTIQRAQDLYCLLKEHYRDSMDLMLFHSRFPANEREEKEKSLLKKFGRNGDHRPFCSLVIATQVIEQSLDVDFDFMVSDLAPIDLLLQRAGRIHRHERTRSELHQTASLTISGLLKETPPNLGETQWKFVYDPYLLYLTWVWIREESLWELPQDIDRLVQLIYENKNLPEDISPEIIDLIDRANGELLAQENHQATKASHAALDCSRELTAVYNQKSPWEEGDSSLLTKTRLGKDSITIVPVFVSAEGWRLKPDQDPFDPHIEIGDALAKQIYMRQLKISRFPIIKELKKEELPAGFQKHPLLKHIKPLKLENNQFDVGNQAVQLDSDLGLIYKSLKNSQQRN